MNRNIIWILSLAVLPLSANVRFDTTIRDVNHRGSSELIGTLKLTFNDSELATARPETPNYIMITPDHGSLLAETRVELASSDPAINRPIYLAMGIESQRGSTLNAPANTLAIVRWVAGEDTIWIRVMHSSDLWVLHEGVVGPPNRDDEVFFKIGTSARESDQEYVAINGQANLPFNTRDLTAQEGQTQLASSVSLCMNLKESSLRADGSDESLLKYHWEFYNYEVEIGLGVYSREAGQVITEIVFPAYFSLARGKSRNLGVAPGLSASGEASSEAAGFVAYRNQLGFRVLDERGHNILSTDIHNGSVLRLQANGAANYGFDSGDVFFASPGIAPGDPVFGSPITVGGRTLYRTVDLVWTNGTTSLAKPLSLNVDVTAHYLENNPPTSMPISWQFLLASHDGAEDSAPYTGPDQHLRCQPELLAPIEPSTWIMNGCHIESVTLIGNTLTIEGQCPSAVDVYARDRDGNFVLIASGVEVDGVYHLTLDQVLPEHYYGVVPAGAVPTDENYIHTAFATVPTLQTWALLLFLVALCATGMATLRMQRQKSQRPLGV